MSDEKDTGECCPAQCGGWCSPEALAELHANTNFKDMLFNKQTQAQHIVANPGDVVPRFVVVLERDGENGVGEEMGKVTLYRYNELISGEELEAELTRKLEASGGNKDVVFQYGAQLDKAQGYAQGMLDGLQVALGLAGRSS